MKAISSSLARKSLSIIALLLLTSTAYAGDDVDTVYQIPIIPDEATKVELLKFAYILNKYSMVRHGDIDMSGVVRCLQRLPRHYDAQKRREACLFAQ